MANQQLDALKLAEQVKHRMVDFSLGDHFSRDTGLHQVLEKMWKGSPDKGGLVSDLWVEGAFPSEGSGKSLQDFVDAGMFDKGLQELLDQNGGFGRDWGLHSHQNESLEKGCEGYRDSSKPAIVVSAGTGAGKTECFLLPMLNQLFKEQPKSGEGVSAILLYPMNALVNDQVDRLERWLSGQDAVTLFHFTSETPEDNKAFKYLNAPEPDICRFRTRKQARGWETRGGKAIPDGSGPIPKILVTNYSMLEYMLCRPQDQVFFGKNLSTIVLDEAHLYTGTLAAEMTLLLRRLLHRCGRLPNEVMQFATSATIGGDAQTELVSFIGKLFGKIDRNVIPIEGRPLRNPLKSKDKRAPKFLVDSFLKREWPPGALVETSPDGNQKLRVASGPELDQWCALMETIASKGVVAQAREGADSTPARLLKLVVEQSPIVHKIEELLWTKKRVPLFSLSEALFGDTHPDTLEATRRLLFLSAAARGRVDEYPSVPNRIHFLVHAPEGITCFFDANQRKSGQQWETSLGTFTLLPGAIERCPETKQYGLGLYRCANCGEFHWAGVIDGNRLRAPGLRDDPKSLAYFQPVPTPKDQDVIYFDPEKGEMRGAGKDAVKLIRNSGKCRHCGAENEFRSFIAGSQLYIGVLAETILAGLPELPSSSCSWLPARGRRLLTFSDSRAEAARLGARLTHQHEVQLLRAALVRAMQEESVADEALEFYRNKIKSSKEQLERAKDPAFRSMLEKEIQTAQAYIEQATSGGSIDDWASRLKESSIIKELLHPENKRMHDLGWNQKDWEKNSLGLEHISRLLANDIASRARWPNLSLETLGFLEVVYPGLDNLKAPPGLLGVVPQSAVAPLEEHWPDLVALICDSLRQDGAITLGSDELDQSYPRGSYLVGRWAALDESLGSSLIRMRGATMSQSRNAFVWRIAREWNVPEGNARDEFVMEVMSAVFNQLISSNLRWIQTEQRQTATGVANGLRLSLPELALRPPKQLFRCQTTGQVWTHAVEGDAPASVSLKLSSVRPEQLEADPRIGRQRRELAESSIFEIGLWSEEHSAQLAPQENRRLQELFKRGVRNILSSTTTLELGIDIGGLNAVLMGNLPPGKASYLQRAGRAGRRADGSSVVVGFARNRSYDNHVFRSFGDFLDARLRKPRIFLDRHRLVARQLNSFLLGGFFQSITTPGAHAGAMTAFGKMGGFCGLPVAEYWDAKRSTKPELVPSPPPPPIVSEKWKGELPENSPLAHYFPLYLADIRENKQACDEIHELLKGTVFEGEDPIGLLESAEDSFEKVLAEWRKDYDTLLENWKALPPTAEHVRATANAISYQLRTLHDITVIEALADLQFLPRYGFPIGLSRLRVVTGQDTRRGPRLREEDRFRLERSAVYALSDYVPGSQLFVGGEVITSHGILKHWTGSNINAGIGLRGTKTKCSRGHVFYSFSGTPGECPVCQEASDGSREQLLFPRFGFTTAAWDPPKSSSEFERVGAEHQELLFIRQGKTKGIDLENFAEIQGLNASYWQDAEVLATNSGENGTGFAVCLKCGYSASERKRGPGDLLPSGFEHHPSMFATKATSFCSAPSELGQNRLRHQVFAARQCSDLVLLDFSPWVRFANATDQLKLLGIAQALRMAGCQLLELDERDLGILSDLPGGTRGDGRSIAIYDTLPGGAGHVYELSRMAREWLEAALKRLFISEEHHSRCESGCLDCILSFDQQRLGTPDRVGAYKLLKSILRSADRDAPFENEGCRSESLSRALADARKRNPSARKEWMELETALREGLIEDVLFSPINIAAEKNIVPTLDYEISGKAGIEGHAVLAWIERKIAIVYKESSKEVFEKQGWKVLIADCLQGSPDELIRMLKD